MRHVYAIATMDTKGDELMYVAQCLKSSGVAVRTVDVSTLSAARRTPDVSREEVLGDLRLPTQDGQGQHGHSRADRGAAVTRMGQALADYLSSQTTAGKVAGVLGIGGSGGTALITAAMRQLPIGLPKLMVSTVASGNTAPYVDCSDIMMMYSVVDVAGLNAVSTRILGNAAYAMAGMVEHAVQRPPEKPTVGLTMFGVTTPCVTSLREALEAKGFDCLVFHATGTGGRAMEQLVTSGMIGGVLDVTTTEVADEVVGGVFPSGPHRFDALLQQEIPLVLSLGALDMVNFGSFDTVPHPFRERQLIRHNDQVTLMRTTAQENREIASWIARKLNRSTAPLTVVVPQKGLSSLDAPGQPFYDPEADQVLFDELERQLEITEQRRYLRQPDHINDRAFALALLRHYQELVAS